MHVRFHRPNFYLLLLIFTSFYQAILSSLDSTVGTGEQLHFTMVFCSSKVCQVTVGIEWYLISMILWCQLWALTVMFSLRPVCCVHKHNGGITERSQVSGIGECGHDRAACSSMAALGFFFSLLHTNFGHSDRVHLEQGVPCFVWLFCLFCLVRLFRWTTGILSLL